MILPYIYFDQRLLDHLKEAAFFSAKDLDSASHTLDKMQDTLQRGKETYSPHLLTLLEHRLNKCRNILAELQASLADLAPALTPVHERLVSILRSISAANTRSKVWLVPIHNHRLTKCAYSSQQRRLRVSGINLRRFKLLWLMVNSWPKTGRHRRVKP